jgi:hypothetical protein
MHTVLLQIKKSFIIIDDIYECIYDYRRWGGDCVAKVMMQKTPPGEPPTYGRIEFRRAATAAAVLAGRPLVKLVVNRRHLWARKYVPRPPQPQQH